MTTKRAELARLARVFDPEMAHYAALAFPDKARETEAQRIDRERKQAERTATALALRGTRDALLAGDYGKNAKAKATEYAIVHGKDSTETLDYCSRLAAKLRTSEYYQRLRGEKKREVD